MKVGDVVAWTPIRGYFEPQHVKFVGVVTGTPVEYSTTEKTRVPVIWNESTTPTMTDIRDIKVIEAISESR